MIGGAPPLFKTIPYNYLVQNYSLRYRRAIPKIGYFTPPS